MGQRNILFGLCLLFSVSQCLHLTSTGGYSDVVIRVDDDVKSQDCDYLMDSLRNMLTSASKDLHNMLSGEILIRKYFYRCNIKIFRWTRKYFTVENIEVASD